MKLDAASDAAGASLRLSVYVIGLVKVESADAVSDVTVGATESYVVAAVPAMGAAGNDEPPTVTASVLSDSVTSPWVGATPLRVTVYGPAPDPVTEATDQPVLLPPTVKSLASRPVGAPVAKSSRNCMVVVFECDATVVMTASGRPHTRTQPLALPPACAADPP